MTTERTFTNHTETQYGFSLSDAMAKGQGRQTYSLWTRLGHDGTAHILQTYDTMKNAVADFDTLQPMAAAWDQDIWLFAKDTGVLLVRLANGNHDSLRAIVAAIESATPSALRKSDT